MVFVVRVVDLVVERPGRVVGAHDIIRSDHFERVGVLEHQVKGAVAGISDNDFPRFRLVVLIDEEHLHLLGLHLVRARAWRLELD